MDTAPCCWDQELHQGVSPSSGFCLLSAGVLNFHICTVGLWEEWKPLQFFAAALAILVLLSEMLQLKGSPWGSLTQPYPGLSPGPSPSGPAPPGGHRNPVWHRFKWVSWGERRRNVMPLIVPLISCFYANQTVPGLDGS